MSTASTVPSPHGRRGPGRGPLPSGPWPTNASRRCATRSTARVARLTIDREERRNALSWALVGELREALALAKADDAVRVVVLTGAGTAAFCAGADLEGMADGAGFTELHEGRGQLADLFRDLYALGKPTIARVQGYALAGGFGLALACDLVDRRRRRRSSARRRSASGSGRT